jgi:hypothetical protein
MKVFKCCLNCAAGVKVAVPKQPNAVISQERIDELNRFNATKRFCIAVNNPRIYNARERRYCKGFEPRRLFDGESYYAPLAKGGQDE